MMTVVRKVQKDLPRSEKEITKVARGLEEVFGHTRFASARITADGAVSYVPVLGELNADLLLKHLNGDTILGSYALTETDMVWWLGWDIDSQDRIIAREYALQILSHLDDIPHCIEYSGGKGYHILIFLAEPITASKAKQIVEYVRDLEGLPRAGKSHVECYPKQAKLTQSNPMGNLLKIPLGIHPRTHETSMFVDPFNGWEGGEGISPLEVLGRKVDPELLEHLLEAEEQDAIVSLAKVLAPSWVTGERHSLALNLAGYLANTGWGMQQVEDLIVMICGEAGDDDEITNRVEAVQDTFQKMSEGKQVAGYMYLADVLPGSVMNMVMELARSVATPPIMKKLEGIRLSKGATFTKVAACAEIIWQHLGEVGMVLKTPTGLTYWYNSDTHLILDMGSERWIAHVHKFYGLNPADSFGNQVLKSIFLKSLMDGKMVEVHTRSFWDGSQLYVNLGGPEVYILDGKKIGTGYNGECGVIFTTYADQRVIPIPDLDTDQSAWAYLTDDLSFEWSENVTAKPEEQRELLRAWILAFFFPQVMETRPILCVLGAPGSGKTSMMRRIIHVLEGVKEDVLSLVEDKPDSLRSSITSHRLVVLDNLEQSRAHWLVNILNTLATGSIIELRQLYKTNESFKIEPNVFVALTAVDVPFSESTLHSRLLPIELSVIKSVIPEALIQKAIKQNQEAIWGDLLLMLSACVKELRRNHTVTAPTESRLADFTVFVARIAQAGVLDAEQANLGLRNLVERQKMQMLQASRVVEMLDDYVQSQPEEANEWHSYTQLVEKLGNIAFKRKVTLDRCNTAASLKRHLEPRRSILEKWYGMETRPVMVGFANREQIRFTMGVTSQVESKPKKKRAA